MKMIRAIVRPEKVEEIVNSLEKEGFNALTKINVFGRGKQKGIQIGQTRYDELPKVLLMLVVDDVDCENVISTIQKNARTGGFGDGKIFVTEVEKAYTIRTGKEGV
ncbi:MAG TPA: P-II family nitrogen regulator [Halobacteria archaeon]|jgi:nitrogen regulatory protein PII 1|nr:P-II family nitrogen regulator [Halobacteria archaeon]